MDNKQKSKQHGNKGGGDLKKGKCDGQPQKREDKSDNTSIPSQSAAINQTVHQPTMTVSHYEKAEGFALYGPDFSSVGGNVYKGMPTGGSPKLFNPPVHPGGGYTVEEYKGAKIFTITNGNFSHVNGHVFDYTTTAASASASAASASQGSPNQPRWLNQSRNNNPESEEVDTPNSAGFPVPDLNQHVYGGWNAFPGYPNHMQSQYSGAPPMNIYNNSGGGPFGKQDHDFQVGGNARQGYTSNAGNQQQGMSQMIHPNGQSHGPIQIILTQQGQISDGYTAIPPVQQFNVSPSVAQAVQHFLNASGHTITIGPNSLIGPPDALALSQQTAAAPHAQSDFTYHAVGPVPSGSNVPIVTDSAPIAATVSEISHEVPDSNEESSKKKRKNKAQLLWEFAGRKLRKFKKA